MIPDLFFIFTLILLGFILLTIELVIIPGFGFVGISGLLCLVIASYISYTRLNLLACVAVSIMSIVVLIIMIKVLPRTWLWKKLRLETTTARTAGYSAVKEGLDKLVGKEGITLTPLRPVGTAIIDGNRIDVVTDVGVIEKDRKIVVVKVDGYRIVVKEV